MVQRKVLTFKNGFHYPFNRAKGLWNILWILLPIIGWFALSGYTIRIIQNFVNGKFEALPLFSFKDHFKFGFFMFIKSLPFVIAYVIVYMLLSFVPYVGFLANLFISLFIVPILGINFFYKETVEAYFEFSKVRSVFDHFEDYFIALIKSIGLGIIFLLMIIVLVGLPAGAFTKNIFLADFYGRKVK